MRLFQASNSTKFEGIRNVIFFSFLVLLLSFLLISASSIGAQIGERGADNSVYEGSPRIVGGQEADPGEWPWQVALVWSGGDIYYHQYCAGTLIDPNWVITAAHCVDFLWPEDLQIIAGIHNLGYPDVGYERLDVAEIIVHPNYDYDKIDYDIAILKLATPAPFRRMADEGLAIAGIAPVSSSVDSLDGEISTVIGWGARGAPYYDYPFSLQEVELPIVSNSTCNAAYGGRISERMMCAGYLEGGKDSCYGDSGGPLMVFNPISDRWELAGIVSWGYGCAEEMFPGVYSRVSVFHNWILSEIGDDFAIEGRITDSQGNGVQDVTLSIGNGKSTKTNVGGYYSFDNLPAGSYTLTPSKGSITFSPLSRVVTVPPTTQFIDFTAGSLQWPINSIGAGARGSSTENSNQIVITASGQDIFGNSDSFVFAHKKGSGDLELTARILNWNAAGTNSAKAGLMIRNSLDPTSPHFTIHVTGLNNAIKLKWRSVAGGSTTTLNGPFGITLPAWLRLTKVGDVVTGFYSYDGQLWTQLGQPQTIGNDTDKFEYGMAVTSNALDRNATATFGDTDVVAWTASNIGADATGQTSSIEGIFTTLAAGGDIYGQADSFHYYHIPGSGDMDLRARLLSWNTNNIRSAKAGLMIRASDDPKSPHFTIHVTGEDRGIKLKYRSEFGGQTESVNGPDTFSLPIWLRIQKTGNTLSAYYSTNGSIWTKIGTNVQLNNVAQSYLYGVAVTSNSVGTFVQASLSDIKTGSLPSAPTPTPTMTPTPLSTIKPSPTPKATLEVSTTATLTPTVTPTEGLSATPTSTPTLTVTGGPSLTPTGTATATEGPSPTPTGQPGDEGDVFLPVVVGR